MLVWGDESKGLTGAGKLMRLATREGRVPELTTLQIRFLRGLEKKTSSVL